MPMPPFSFFSPSFLVTFSTVHSTIHIVHPDRPSDHNNIISTSTPTMMNATAMLRPLLSRQVGRQAASRCSAASSSALPSVSVAGTGSISSTRRFVHIEKKMEELGIELPAAPLPKANYNIVCLPPGENIMYVSGHLPIKVRLSKKEMQYYLYLKFFEKLSIIIYHIILSLL